MGFREKAILTVLLSLLLFVAGCPTGVREEISDENRQQQQQSMPREIDKMESRLFEIMQLANLVPVVEAAQNQNPEEGSGNRLTFEETILGEILKREAAAQAGGGDEDEPELPEDTTEIWDNIKMNVTELHRQWNELEPVITREKISENTTAAFEEDLDNLTALSTEQNHLGTLATANQLAGYLSKFRVPFAESVEALAYELRFHVRNIVLQATAGNYEKARGSLEYFKEQRPALNKAFAEEEAAELDTSLDDLERALDKQELDLVKIKAAVVMENLVQNTDNSN